MHHSSMLWEISLLYFFSWNFIWFLQKEPTTVQNFRLLTAQVKFHQICTLIGYFCWKYIKFQVKKVWRKYVSWYQRVVQNLKKNLFFCFKNDKNLVNFYSSTKKSKKIAFWLVPFFAKYTKFDLKKYRGNIFHDTEEPYEIWRKTDLRFRKWHEEFGKFSSEHFKVSRLVF